MYLPSETYKHVYLSTLNYILKNWTKFVLLTIYNYIILFKNSVNNSVKIKFASKCSVETLICF